MPTLAEFSQLALLFSSLIFETLENFLEILNHGNFPNVWGIIFGFLNLNSYNLQLIEKILDITEKNATALSKFGTIFDLAGKNSKVLFGDIDGNCGITYIQSGVLKELESSAAITESFTGFLEEAMKFLNNLMLSYGNAFRSP